MTVEEAIELLNSCTREEARDHAFGDSEIFWSKDGEEIAGGYFGKNSSSVWVTVFSFEEEDALKLRDCGTLSHVERNDKTGPDAYVEGVIMPGLTKEDVFRELNN